MNETRLFISSFEIKEARRLFAKILLFVPVLLFVAAVNLYIDPMGLYSKAANKDKRHEYQAAQALLEGKNVELLQESIDYRLIQKYFIENMTVAPDIAILGSSHSMWLGDNIFPGKRVINNSILEAVLADYLAVFEGYAKKGLYPKRVICVLDPGLVLFPFTSQKWVSNQEDTYGMLERLGIHSSKIKVPAISQAWLNIFSFSYFQKSVDEFYHEKNRQDYRVTQAVSTGRYLMFKDGRCLLGFFLKDPEKNRRKTRMELRHGPFIQGLNEREPDQELEGTLESFIRYLMGQHIQVTLCLLPLQPDLYKILRAPQGKQGVLDIASFEHYYRTLAQKFNLEIIGSYDPAACGLQDNDFYDEDHIRNDVIERMLRQKGTLCSMPGLY